MSISKRPEKLKSNLLKQNCYVSECSGYIAPPSDSAPEYFESLDEVTEYDGVKLKRTVRPYPITPAYVSSFAACDYHNDPLSAVSVPQKGGIVDLTAIPDLASLDTGAVYNILQLLKAAQSSPKKTEQSSPKKTEKIDEVEK